MVRTVCEYFCEICDASFDKHAGADACERLGGRPRLVKGDLILRTGLPGRLNFEDRFGGFSLDVVLDTYTNQPSGLFGDESDPHHTFGYLTTSGEKRSVEERHIHPCQTGVLNSYGLGWGPIHTDQVEHLYGRDPGLVRELDEVCRVFRPFFPRRGYPRGQDLADFASCVYSLTWSGLDSSYPLWLKVPTELLPLLLWVAEPMSPAEIIRETFPPGDEGRGRGGRFFRQETAFAALGLVGDFDLFRYWRWTTLTDRGREAFVARKIEDFLAGRQPPLSRVTQLFKFRVPGGRRPRRFDELCERYGIGGLKPRQIFGWFDSYDNRREWGVKTQPGNSLNTYVGDAPIFAVASGKGGVGKSTVAANLARGLAARGHRPCVVDVDAYGPSMPIAFDCRGPLRTREGRILPHEVEGVRVISLGNMVAPGASVNWRGPVLDGFIKLIFGATDFGDSDCLVLDLPPGTGDVQLTLMQSLEITQVFVVATGDELALADVARSLESFRDRRVTVGGIVGNMTHVEAEGHVLPLFGGEGRIREFAAAQGTEMLCGLPYVGDREEIVRRLAPVVERCHQAIAGSATV